MRVTRIFFRRTRVVNSFFLGGLFALVLSFLVSSVYVFSAFPDAPQSSVVAAVSAEPEKPLKDELKDLRIVSFFRLPDGSKYVFATPDGKRVTAEDLQVKNIVIKDRGPREALLVRDKDFLSVYR